MTENSSTRIYGPLSVIHIKKLEEQLNSVGSRYKVFKDEELLKKAQTRAKGSVEASPMLHNSPGFILKEYLFIEIPLKDLLVVRQTLIQLGYEQTIDSKTQETLHIEEYVCPKCDHMQHQLGYCPRHHLKLMPYFEKRKTKIKINELAISLIIVITLLYFFGATLFEMFKQILN